MKRKVIIMALAAALLLSGCGNVSKPEVYRSSGEKWTIGYAERTPALPDAEILYMAGYHNDWPVRSVHDLQKVSALWVDTGDAGFVWITVDSVGLFEGPVKEIRKRLKEFCEEARCASVNVCSTHDHAGIDTMGLWGPVGQDGRNAEYMENVISACVDAAEEAWKNRRAGELRYGKTGTSGLQYDSRKPEVFDSSLYQLRFVPEDGSHGIRIVNYAAHAESLRGANAALSRDYPGVMADLTEAETGDRLFFTQGAIGGLLMTAELYPASVDPVRNMEETGSLLTKYLLSIPEESERTLKPCFGLSRVTFEVPMDNDLYMYYKFLGILDHEVHEGKSRTGYAVTTELTVLTLDDLAVIAVPGELFPELLLGDHLTEEDPESLRSIAEKAGWPLATVCGLANDELGYIVTPSDYLLNEEHPYLERACDKKGEDHYEETNSCSKNEAYCVAEACRKAFDGLKK